MRLGFMLELRMGRDFISSKNLIREEITDLIEIEKYIMKKILKYNRQLMNNTVN